MKAYLGIFNAGGVVTSMRTTAGYFPKCARLRASLTVFSNEYRGNNKNFSHSAQNQNVSVRSELKVDEESFESILKSLCENKQYGQAWNLYRSSEDWIQYLSYNSLQTLLSQCLRNRNLAAAVTVFEDMKMVGYRPNKVTFSMLISGLCKHRRKGSGFRELGYKYWKELENYHNNLDSAALRIGMQACVGVGNLQEAEQILTVLEQSNSHPDIRTYNILINGYAKDRNTSAIEGLFKRMIASKIKPSITTYNALISSHVKRGRMEEARRCLERAKAEGVSPDAWTYTTIMKGHVNLGDFKSARMVWDEMIASGEKPTPVSFSVMIDCAIEDRDMKYAQKLLDTMHKQGEHPSPITFNLMLRAYIAENDQDSLIKATKILDTMESANIVPVTDTFNMLMSAAVSSGNASLAELVYSKLLRMGQHPNGYTYTILINVYAKQAKLSEAVTTFENLTKDRHASVDIAAYNAMVDAFARSGEMQAAEKMLERACTFAENSGTGPPVEAFGAVVAGYVRLKMVNAAVNTVRKFHAIGGEPDVQMLDQLIDLCVRTGEYKVAMQAVRAMELVGAKIDKEKYKSMIANLEEKYANKSRKLDAGDNSSSAYLERFKFWLGLPNNYYSNE